MKKWIYRPHVEGQASRQAHADLPEGTVERELGKEGFFGPATHMVHPRPPTGWTSPNSAFSASRWRSSAKPGATWPKRWRTWPMYCASARR